MFIERSNSSRLLRRRLRLLLLRSSVFLLTVVSVKADEAVRSVVLILRRSCCCRHGRDFDRSRVEVLRVLLCRFSRGPVKCRRRPRVATPGTSTPRWRRWRSPEWPHVVDERGDMGCGEERKNAGFQVFSPSIKVSFTLMTSSSTSSSSEKISLSKVAMISPEI